MLVSGTACIHQLPILRLYEYAEEMEPLGKEEEFIGEGFIDLSASFQPFNLLLLLRC